MALQSLGVGCPKWKECDWWLVNGKTRESGSAQGVSRLSKMCPEHTGGMAGKFFENYIEMGVQNVKNVTGDWWMVNSKTRESGSAQGCPDCPECLSRRITVVLNDSPKSRSESGIENYENNMLRGCPKSRSVRKVRECENFRYRSRGTRKRDRTPEL